MSAADVTTATSPYRRMRRHSGGLTLPFCLGLGSVLRNLKAIVSDDSFQRLDIRMKERLIQLVVAGQHRLHVRTAGAVGRKRRLRAAAGRGARFLSSKCRNKRQCAYSDGYTQFHIVLLALREQGSTLGYGFGEDPLIALMKLEPIIYCFSYT
jgi:hypothetical protein